MSAHACLPSGQLTLFPLPALPRPEFRSEAVARAAARSLAVDVADWLDESAGLEVSVDDIVDDLSRVLQDCTHDGYDLAGAVGREMSVSPDAELVAILEEAPSEMRAAYADLCRAWVKESGLVGPAVGSRVAWSARPAAGVGIVRENKDDGSALVCFPALGHVAPGSFGTIGLWIMWEKLTPVSEGKESAR